MRIGIVTVQYANNFGATLQAYGLKSVLEKMGHQVFYIKNCTDKYARGLFYRIRPYGKEYRYLLKFILKNYRGWKQYRAFQSVQEEFKIIECWSEEQLDLVILGSDEIWNVTNPLFKHSIFYGQDMYPVMTYAVSIGNATYDDMKIIPLEYFKNIHPILVRDTMTWEYLKSIGISSKKVCDPTILAEKDIFYNSYHHRLMKKPYLLVYAYGHLETEKVKQSIRNFAKEQGLKIISVCFYLDWCDGTINCSPMEFSAVIKQAKYIYTSTFHGTIFSILNHKSFISLPYSIKTIDLLESLQLSDRVVSLENCDETILEKKWIYDSIDYEVVDEKIKYQRQQSEQFLIDGINRISKDVLDRGKKTVPRLYEKKTDCCGCSACYSICPVHAIYMEEDTEGFLYPQIIENRCIHCNQCVDVCNIKYKLN